MNHALELRDVCTDEAASVEGGWSLCVQILMQYHQEALGYTSEQAHEYAASLTPSQRA